MSSLLLPLPRSFSRSWTPSSGPLPTRKVSSTTFNPQLNSGCKSVAKECSGRHPPPCHDFYGEGCKRRKCGFSHELTQEGYAALKKSQADSESQEAGRSEAEHERGGGPSGPLALSDPITLFDAFAPFDACWQQEERQFCWCCSSCLGCCAAFLAADPAGRGLRQRHQPAHAALTGFGGRPTRLADPVQATGHVLFKHGPFRRLVLRLFWAFVHRAPTLLLEFLPHLQAFSSLPASVFPVR